MATNKKVNVILSAVDRTAPAFKSVTGNIKAVIGSNAAMAAGAAAAGLALVAMAAQGAKATARLVKDMGDLGDRFDKMSMRLGESTEDLSRWEYVVRLNGGSAETYEKAVKKLNQTIYDASLGLKTYTRLFDDLGVAYQNNDGSMRSSTAVMLDMADALSRVESQSKRNAIASKMMGRSGTELLPVLQQGSDAIRAQMAELERLGGVIDTDFTKSAAALVDAELRIEMAWRGLKIAFADAFLDEAADGVNDVAIAIADVGSLVSEHKDEIRAVAVGIADMAVALVDMAAGAKQAHEELRPILEPLQKLMAWSVAQSPYAGPAAMQGRLQEGGAARRGQRDAHVFGQEFDWGPAPPLLPGLRRRQPLPEVSPAPVLPFAGPVSDAEKLAEEAYLNDAIEEGIALWDKYEGDGADALDGVEKAGMSAAENIGAQFADMFAMMVVQGGDIEDMFGSLLKTALSMGLSIGVKSILGIPVLAAGGRVPGAAAGFAVPDGPRGLDSRLIAAMPGEEVISRKLSQRLDRFLGLVEVGELGAMGGGGATVVKQYVNMPANQRDLARLGRVTHSAVADRQKGIF